jgi:hypothetical protein
MPADVKINIANTSLPEKPFGDLFYLIEETKSGCHQPEGILWIKTGRGWSHERRVSVLDVFPTILELMEIVCSSSGSHPRKGRSLVSDWSGAAAPA